MLEKIVLILLIFGFQVPEGLTGAPEPDDDTSQQQEIFGNWVIMIDDVINRIYNVTPADFFIAIHIVSIFGDPWKGRPWTMIDDIRIRNLLNAMQQLQKESNAFQNPDMFDVLKLSRSLFCRHYLCRVGHCSFLPLQEDDNDYRTAVGQLQTYWSRDNHNFGEESVMEWFNSMDFGTSGNEVKNEVVPFWNDYFYRMILLKDEFEELQEHPEKFPGIVDSMLQCTCENDFTGISCDQCPSDKRI
uniref:uncharacterized protein LOC120338149 n=1 Tax=Styela clava TaxID=7725 RepID=UPI00193A2FA1|nr:uncharacterized protein LOC120338149 [Styela clava]